MCFAVLSGERVSQMTKTYDDVAAITLLLEEVRFTLLVIARVIIIITKSLMLSQSLSCEVVLVLYLSVLCWHAFTT